MVFYVLKFQLFIYLIPFHPNYEKFYLHKANILVQLDRKDESIVILVME